ncbi:MAG: carboxypeptidase regulatory-like domain-containing protein [Acidobacteria bacterium]|nr:carboxypeptidase regulatory-like domain-containing protein [Acidobacteriota bacterium]MCA1627292.1 carboxypeptidase regulatory-like domain-containing protein [Acidobacteriota bacterium]
MKQASLKLLLQTVCVSLLITLFSSTAFAQFETGEVSGFVVDKHGAALRGATVKVVHGHTRAEHQTNTDETGYYIFTNLMPGEYEISIENPGFQKFSQRHTNVDAHSKVRIDVSLEPKGATETVTVIDEPPVIQRDSAVIAKTIERRDIEDLALNGRNPINFVLLAPGVRGGPFNSFNPDDLGAIGFSINGSRLEENLITIDGVIATRTRASAAIIGVVNADTVHEMKILTSNYLPEYGRSSGGQVRFVTRSGGNDFHGSVFEFFRNSALDANSWGRNASNNPDLARKPAPFTYNQFGYSFSGPLALAGKTSESRTKLFFFWAQEWIRWRRFDTSIQTVPTVKMRRGDFSELLSPNNSFFGRPVFIRDPLKTGECNDVDQTACFPGNLIPVERLSPNGIALLSTYPLPTPGFQRGASNYIAQSRNPRDTRKDTLRLDYFIATNHQLSFRGSLFNWKSVDAFRGAFPLARTDWKRPNRTAALSWTSQLFSGVVNELTVGAAVDRVFINVFDNGLYQREQYGINYPYLFAGKEINDKIPTITVSNFSTVDGGPYPAFSSGPIYTVSNNLTKSMGQHSIKSGVFVEYSGENDFDQINVQPVPGGTNNQNGRFEFTNTRSAGTGLAVANAALGLFTNYGEIGQRAYTPWRAWATDLFIQDTWRVRPDLTLEYGTRYSYWQPWRSLWGNIAMFHPAFYDPAKAATIDPAGGFLINPTFDNRFNGLVLPGNFWPKAAIGRVEAASDSRFDSLFRGLPEGQSKTHKNVFEPRVGLAYSFGETSKTVVRAGAGIFHNRVTLNDSTLLGGNAPIQFMSGVTNGLADAPAGGTMQTFPLVVTMQDPEFKHPTSYQYNLTLQRELPFATTIEIGYVGRIGLYLQRERNINQLLPGTRQANPGINPDALRPYTGFGVIRLSENAGRSEYNGLQVSARRRFNKGLSFGVTYTLSRLTDDASNRRERLFNAYDAHSFHGVSGDDRTHVFNLHYIYELPFRRRSNTFMRKVLGGWQISGVALVVSGQPLTVCRGDDDAGVGDSDCQPWNLVGNTEVESPSFSRGRNVDQNFWFNPAAFARPAPGTFGNARRNILRGPVFQSWDIAISKTFSISEGTRLQFRSEFFNFPNHPNLANPDTNPTSPNFGRVLGKAGERNVQFGLRLYF